MCESIARSKWERRELQAEKEMVRLFKSAAVQATKQWLQDHFHAYPQGISKVYQERRSGEVRIRLEEPLDLDFFETVITGHGLDSEITADEDGTRVLNAYSVVRENGDIVTKSLQSVFREQRDQAVAPKPVRESGTHPRLFYICDYLRGKYG